MHAEGFSIASHLLAPNRNLVAALFVTNGRRPRHGWLMRHRQLVRDYENTETSAEAWIFIAMIRIQLRRLA